MKPCETDSQNLGKEDNEIVRSCHIQRESLPWMIFGPWSHQTGNAWLGLGKPLTAAGSWHEVCPAKPIRQIFCKEDNEVGPVSGPVSMDDWRTQKLCPTKCKLRNCCYMTVMFHNNRWLCLTPWPMKPQLNPDMKFVLQNPHQILKKMVRLAKIRPAKGGLPCTGFGPWWHLRTDRNFVQSKQGW